MNLAQLLHVLDADAVGGMHLSTEQADALVTGVTSDSREVAAGMVFVAVVGTNFDGHSAIADAVRRGALAVVAERRPESPLHVPVVEVRDTRLAYSKLTVTYRHNPSSRLRLYGVTGTNGKTTCATLLEQLMTLAGRNVGFIGATGNRYNGVQYPTNYSTPHAGQLAELFDTMANAGVDSACMEVSSHALDQHRVYGIAYRGAMFTNLTRDHLDYHGTIENYAKSKKRLFDGLSELLPFSGARASGPPT